MVSRMSPPQVGHVSGNSSPARAIGLAQAIREVVGSQFVVEVAAVVGGTLVRGLSADRQPPVASRSE
jgi:hypothetical protein